MIDALLSNTQCKGITIMREPAPGYDDDSRVDKIWEMKRRSAHWDLQMDYNPGSKTYGWVLFPNEAGPMSAGPSVRGEGDSAGNAYQICVVITKEPTTNK